MKRSLVLLVPLFVSILACASHDVRTLPTPPSGVVRGVVADSSGAFLPGVTVHLGNRSAVTDAQGVFIFTGVPAGSHAFVAELSGFTSATYLVTLTPEHGAAVYAVLRLGSVSEAITVTASAPNSFSIDGLQEASAPAVPGPVAGATYSKIEEHKFADARKERTTTFAIDVDRASYAIVRRHLANGLVPPPDAVRIEELLNYFTWSYPQPSGEAPFSITSEVAGCPWNARNRLVRIRIQGRNLEQWKMAPNNLDSLKEAEKVFRRELTGTLVTIAKDVKVQVDFDPVVAESYRQIGYENRALANEDFEDDQKDAGELGAGHSVTALYEVTPAPGAARGPIATVKLRYKEPKGSTSIPLSATIVDEGRSAYEASADMQFATALAQFGMLLRDSPHKGTSSWDDVAHLARLAMGADLDGTREEFTRLAESARGMATGGSRGSKVSH